jgi:hypothetical protein
MSRVSSFRFTTYGPGAIGCETPPRESVTKTWLNGLLELVAWLTSIDLSLTGNCLGIGLRLVNLLLWFWFESNRTVSVPGSALALGAPPCSGSAGLTRTEALRTRTMSVETTIKPKMAAALTSLDVLAARRITHLDLLSKKGAAVTKNVSTPSALQVLKSPIQTANGIMVSNQIILGALLALNIALYIPLVVATVRRRRRKVTASNLADAFSGLELALKEAVPDLPAGFTWEEAVARLRSSGVRTEGIEGALKSYEEYRYGGLPLPDLDFREVVRVANMLGGIKGGGGRASLGR